MSYSDKQTDKQLIALENKIKREYLIAWQELDKKASAYFKTYRDRWKKEFKAFQEGKYTVQQWNDWQISQIARGKRYIELRDDMAKRITDANKVAAAYINDKTPGIYALNYNYSAYQMELETGVAFNVYDEQTIKRLMMDKNHTEFRVNNVNAERDYSWNKKKIDSALISGILQGKSIEHLADGFMQVMKANRSAAIRNARTSFTSAQNGGRQESYERAVEMGIKLEKEWIATLDDRTRDSHQMLDGERVPYNAKFSNKCEYPGDPSGAPMEVYNCRCTMRAILPKYNAGRDTERAYKTEDQREFDENGKPKTAKGMTYRGVDGTKSYSDWLKNKLNLMEKEDKNDIMFIFNKANDLKEVKSRISDSLGIPLEKVSLGRMPIDVANDYLDGIETFVNDFPEIKGLYTGFDTKTGGGKYSVVLGVNKLAAKGRWNGSGIDYDCTFDLALKSGKTSDDIYKYYHDSPQHYKNMSPKSTAIHELTHGLDYAISMREKGYFIDGKLQTTIKNNEWRNWASTVSSGIVKEAKIDLFGKETGNDVYDGIKYLGKYSLTNDKEMMAECVSYEYANPNDSNKYSKLVLNKLKKRVKEVFK